MVDTGLLNVCSCRRINQPGRAAIFTESVTLHNWLGQKETFEHGVQLTVSINGDLKFSNGFAEVREAIHRWDCFDRAVPTGTEAWSLQCSVIGHKWHSKLKLSGTHEVRFCTVCGIQQHRLRLSPDKFTEWRSGRGDVV
jgi:hypothetical protein